MTAAGLAAAGMTVAGTTVYGATASSTAASGTTAASTTASGTMAAGDVVVCCQQSEDSEGAHECGSRQGGECVWVCLIERWQYLFALHNFIICPLELYSNNSYDS